MSRATAILAWVAGLGFGLPGVFGLRHFARTGQIWTFMGFPTYRGGPFERWGLQTNIPLLAGFVALCAAEVVLGVFLWSGRPVWLWASLVLLPLEFFYWIGFALPFGLVFGVARTVLVLILLAR